MEDIKVRLFKYKCGKVRLLVVLDGNENLKESKKEQRKLMESGCDVTTITLNEAREMEMCFDCEL